MEKPVFPGAGGKKGEQAPVEWMWPGCGKKNGNQMVIHIPVKGCWWNVEKKWKTKEKETSGFPLVLWNVESLSTEM